MFMKYYKQDIIKERQTRNGMNKRTKTSKVPYLYLWEPYLKPKKIGNFSRKPYLKGEVSIGQ